MKALREYFWFSLVVGLLSGWLVGGMWKFQHSIPTSDWAARGVPLWDRWIQTGGWFLEGFVPAAAVGFLLGPALYQLIPSDQWLNADPTGARAKRVKLVGNVLLFLFGAGLFVHFLLVMGRVLELCVPADEFALRANSRLNTALDAHERFGRTSYFYRRYLRGLCWHEHIFNEAICHRALVHRSWFRLSASSLGPILPSV